jgi:tetratricopeptide (TPR) repeat protein
MSNRKREARKAGAVTAGATPAASQLDPRWYYFALGAFAAMVAVFWAYGPALNGPFMFDDNYLPFAISDISTQPLSAFLHGQRPLLMASYWLSARLAPQGDTWWFHSLNVVIHCITTCLVFFIVRRLLEWAKLGDGRRGLLAGLAAALFLLHPLQSEAVAYVAGRSDGLSVMLAFSAFTVFLYRREGPIGWGMVAVVFVLFGAALTSKEDTIALPGLFLLTDFWWRPGGWEGIRRNWKLYGPMVLGAAAGMAFFWNLITHASTAGFGLKDFTWYQYLFTQFRAVFVYLGLFFFPANLTLDWDFPISHTLFEHAAIVGLVFLLALIVAAWMLRHRFPLACYGFYAFLILLSPTSSILPIRDPVAERRMYFAILGLLLILVEVLARLKLERKVLTAAGLAVLLLAAIVTHARAEVWADPVAIWEDTARKSPDAWRPHFQLGFAYFSAQPPQCEKALSEFEKAGARHPNDPLLLLDWGLAYDCLNRPEEALKKLEASAVIQPSAQVFSQVGMELGKLQKWTEAMNALNAAQKMDPNFVDTYLYYGIVHTQTNQLVLAVQDFQRALQLDPNNSRARQYLQTVATQLNAQQRK